MSSCFELFLATATLSLSSKDLLPSSSLTTQERGCQISTYHKALSPLATSGQPSPFASVGPLSDQDALLYATALKDSLA